VARGLVESPHLPPGCQLKLRIAICPLDGKVPDYSMAVNMANETLDQMHLEETRTIRWCDPVEVPAATLAQTQSPVRMAPTMDHP
jgi:hypothetical protein